MRKLTLMAVLAVLVSATTLARPSGLVNQAPPIQTAGDVGPGGDGLGG
jgi:hypothetical protein